MSEENCIAISEYINNSKLTGEVTSANSNFNTAMKFINNKETKGYCIMKKENLKLN